MVNFPSARGSQSTKRVKSLQRMTKVLSNKKYQNKRDSNTVQNPLAGAKKTKKRVPKPLVFDAKSWHEFEEKWSSIEPFQDPSDEDKENVNFENQANNDKVKWRVASKDPKTLSRKLSSVAVTNKSPKYGSLNNTRRSKSESQNMDRTRYNRSDSRFHDVRDVRVNLIKLPDKLLQSLCKSRSISIDSSKFQGVASEKKSRGRTRVKTNAPIKKKPGRPRGDTRFCGSIEKYFRQERKPSVNSSSDSSEITSELEEPVNKKMKLDDSQPVEMDPLAMDTKENQDQNEVPDDCGKEIDKFAKEEEELDSIYADLEKRYKRCRN
ncbi:hypothetical protein QAD02_022621 [Eretmocerus hayati]|uniref:Uncharacterized protein n=1 Tax=Eretmocerus hayati TaxID=131215 RepID=A0ACC2PTS6_9HYME|nr:hypothetical protein QAD02_022621 [Eretmocerus hayati]